MRLIAASHTASSMPSMLKLVPTTVSAPLQVREVIPDELDLVGCMQQVPLQGACLTGLSELARSDRAVWVDKRLVTSAERLTPDDVGVFYGLSEADAGRQTMLALLVAQCTDGQLPQDAYGADAATVLARQDCAIDALPTLAVLGMSIREGGSGPVDGLRSRQLDKTPGIHIEGGGPGSGVGFRLNFLFTGPSGEAQEEYLRRLGEASPEPSSESVVEEIIRPLLQPIEPGGGLAQPVVACEDGSIFSEVAALSGESVEGFCGAPGIVPPSEQAVWHSTELEIESADCSEDSRTSLRERVVGGVPVGGLVEACPEASFDACQTWAQARLMVLDGDATRLEDGRCGLHMGHEDGAFAWKLRCRSAN